MHSALPAAIVLSVCLVGSMGLPTSKNLKTDIKVVEVAAFTTMPAESALRELAHQAAIHTHEAQLSAVDAQHYLVEIFTANFPTDPVSAKWRAVVAANGSLNVSIPKAPERTFLAQVGDFYSRRFVFIYQTPQ